MFRPLASPTPARRERGPWLLLLAVVFVLGSTAASAQERGPVSHAAGRAALEEGDAERAVVIFSELAGGPDASAAQLFWWANACYQAGMFEQASGVAERALLLAPDAPDLHYLAGIAAFELGDLDRAEERFDAVIAGENVSLASAARDHLALVRWQRRRDAAVATLERGSVEEARAALEALEVERPGDLVVGYHLGHAASLLGDLDVAIEVLERTAAAWPEDAWTRYALANAYAAVGEAGTALPLLDALGASAGGAVALEAREAAAALRRRQTSPAPPGASAVPDAWLELGAVVDSNPAFFSESSYVGETDRSAGLSVAGAATLAPWSSQGWQLQLIPRGRVTSFVRGADGYDAANLSVGARLAHRADRSRAWLGAQAGWRWLGWAPLLDVQEAWVGAQRDEGDRWSSSAQALVFRRGALLEGYENLSSVGAALSAIQAFQGVRWSVGLGWLLRFERGDAYSVSWEGALDEPTPSTYDARLDAVASFTGHGPSARLRWEPDWHGARVLVEGRWEWRSYGTPESVHYTTDAGSWGFEEERRDRRGTAFAQAGLDVHPRLHVFLRVQAVSNRSSLGAESWVVDRNFERALGTTGVELSL